MSKSVEFAISVFFIVSMGMSGSYAGEHYTTLKEPLIIMLIMVAVFLVAVISVLAYGQKRYYEKLKKLNASIDGKLDVLPKRLT